MYIPNQGYRAELDRFLVSLLKNGGLICMFIEDNLLINVLIKHQILLQSKQFGLPEKVPVIVCDGNCLLQKTRVLPKSYHILYVFPRDLR